MNGPARTVILQSYDETSRELCDAMDLRSDPSDGKQHKLWKTCNLQSWSNLALRSGDVS